MDIEALLEEDRNSKKRAVLPAMVVVSAMRLRVLWGLVFLSVLQTQGNLGMSMAAQTTSVRQENPGPPPSGEGRRERVVLARDRNDLRPRRIQLLSGTELKVRLNDALSTRHNVRGDSFSTEFIEDLVRDGEIVLSAGTLLKGRVTFVRRAGRISGRAEMRLQFGDLALASGQDSRIEASLRGVEDPRRVQKVSGEGQIEGEASKGKDTAKVGTAAGIGALIGVITGGKKGAGIGAGAGGMAGLAGILASRGRDITLKAGSELTLVLDKDVFLVVPARP